MKRKPLRPISEVIFVRKKGQNPNNIEKENIRQRHLRMERFARIRSESRLLVLAGFLLVSFIGIAFKMGLVSMTTPIEPVASSQMLKPSTKRADILDRNGSILATNLITNALYAKPRMMINRNFAAAELAKIFPELKFEKLLKLLGSDRKFVWIKRKISPEQMQAVHELGEPGLRFGPREMRLYPNGRLASHVLGGVNFGKEGVNSAELVGIAGVELKFDQFLQDNLGKGVPLILSLDLGIQSAMEHVLSGGMKLMNAKGATAVLMDIHSGEILSMVSLPDFDPNDRILSGKGKKGSETHCLINLCKGFMS